MVRTYRKRRRISRAVARKRFRRYRRKRRYRNSFRRVKAKVYRELRPEYKYHDHVYNTDTSIPLWGNGNGISAINLVPLGEYNNQRNGNQIHIMSVQVWIEVHMSWTVPPNKNNIRFVLFKSDQQHPETTIEQHMLYQTDQVIGSPRYLPHWKEYTALKDLRLDLKYDTVKHKTRRFYMPLNITTRFEGTGTGVASGLLFYLIGCDTDDLTKGGPSYRIHTRIRYIDV